MFVCDDRSLANGHVVRQSQSAGATMLLDSDAHGPEDLLTTELARQIGKGAGLDGSDLEAVLNTNPKSLLEKLGYPLT